MAFPGSLENESTRATGISAPLTTRIIRDYRDRAIRKYEFWKLLKNERGFARNLSSIYSFYFSLSLSTTGIRCQLARVRGIVPGEL